MTYDIPQDMSDLYIESFGFNEDAMLYFLHLKHPGDSNLLQVNYNIKGDFQEKPFTAYYIRPLNDTDQDYLHLDLAFPLPGYTYLDPSDIYLLHQKSGDETNPEHDTYDSGKEILSLIPI